MRKTISHQNKTQSRKLKIFLDEHQSQNNFGQQMKYFFFGKLSANEYKNEIAIIGFCYKKFQKFPNFMIKDFKNFLKGKIYKNILMIDSSMDIKDR